MRQVEITNRGNPESESSVVIMISGGDPIVIAPGRSHILDLVGGETVWFAPGIPVRTRAVSQEEAEFEDLIVGAQWTAKELAAMSERTEKIELVRTGTPYDRINTALGIVPHTDASLRDLPFGALRDIASGYGIKGRAKEELIREILAAQGAK